MFCLVEHILSRREYRRYKEAKRKEDWISHWNLNLARLALSEQTIRASPFEVPRREKQREDRWRKDREKQKKEVRQFHANIATHVNCRKCWGMCRKMPTLNVFVSRTTCLCSWPGLHMGYHQIAAGASGAITAAWLHGVFSSGWELS